MYGFDYELEPASEGIGSFFEMVLEKIKNAGKMIKDWIDKVALKIRRLTGTTSAKEAKADSAEVTKKINEIGRNIGVILDNCSTCIDRLYEAYSKVGKTEKITKRQYDKDEGASDNYKFNEDDRNAAKTEGKYQSLKASMTAKNGMDKLSDSAKNDSKAMAEWNRSKEELGIAFMAMKGAAEKVSTDLKSLSSYGPLTLKATSEGYGRLREIFNANGVFGARWKKVKIAAEWSTGDIKNALNKVVSLYDVGVRATDAFGRRLSSGSFRENNGEKYKDKEEKKAIMTAAGGVNKVFAHNKSRNDISTSRKDENFASAQFGQESTSYILDRLYQVAYEDAMDDIKTRQSALEAYAEVPGAYEFVEESYDSDFEMDYDPLNELV